MSDKEEKQTQPETTTITINNDDDDDIYFDPHQFDKFSEADKALFNEMRIISMKLRKKGILPPAKILK